MEIPCKEFMKILWNLWNSISVWKFLMKFPYRVRKGFIRNFPMRINDELGNTIQCMHYRTGPYPGLYWWGASWGNTKFIN